MKDRNSTFNQNSIDNTVFSIPFDEIRSGLKNAVVCKKNFGNRIWAFEFCDLER